MKTLATNLLITKALLKYYLLAALLGLLPAGQAAAQTLQELDTLLQQPLRNQIITSSAYAGVLYQKQVALTGLAVQQGKALGTNVTLGDKTVGLNVGLANLKLQSLPNVALIANGRFAIDQGFVKLFSEDNLRVTASFGGTVQLFGHGYSVFSERTKKDLQWQLRDLRHKDKLRWGDSLVPYNPADWHNKHLAIMVNFIEKWSLFQNWLAKGADQDPAADRANRFYKQNGKFNSIELNSIEGERLYLNYLDAEHAARPLLTKEWDDWDQASERAYIWQQLDSQPLPAMPRRNALEAMLLASPQFARTLALASRLANQQALRKRAFFYDSLQQRVSWARKWRSWATIQGLHTSAEQPVFDAANRAGTYAGTASDKYWQFQAAYNGLLEGQTVNISGSLGGGTSNGLVFRKADLRTYQTSTWQHNGTDSALVVTQKSLYASTPTRLRYWNLQTQFTATLSKGLPGFGFTSTYEVLLARDTHAVHNLTLGLILPLRTTESTLLFIPQARARGGDLPDRWSFGFTVTATVPSFLLNTFK